MDAKRLWRTIRLYTCKDRNKYIDIYPELEDAVRKVFSDMKGIVRRFEYTDEWIESLKEQNIRVLYLSNISKTLYNDCE